MGIIGGAISGIGSVVSTMINSQTAKRNTDLTNLANKQMAEYQYSKDLEMWNRQNQYNDPSQQMARFKLAGLNPNLIYGQGNAGNAVTLPKYQAPTLKYDYKPELDPFNALSGFMDLKLKQAQVDNVKAQTDNTKTETVIKSLNADKLETEKPYWSNLLGAKDSDGNPMYGMSKANYLLKNSELRKYDAEVKQALINNAMKEIDLKWYKAEKWLSAGKSVLDSGAKVAGAFGLNKLIRQNFNPYKPSYGLRK